MPRLVLGTRGSRLALVQARWVAERLRELAPDLDVELEVIDARRRLDPADPALGEGIFVKEIQRALLDRRIDAGVHSLKDLPTAPVDGLAVAAIPVRADPREALVGSTLNGLPAGGRVGTSSPRRSAQLRRLRPDVEIAPLAGNIPTRIRRVRQGEYAAAMLAAAGLGRLGLPADELLDLDLVLPAPGQGALAVEVRADSPGVARTVEALHDPDTAAATEAERAVLRSLGGGCLLPVSAYGAVQDGRLTLEARVISADGTQQVAERTEGPIARAAQLAAQVAACLLERGAGRLLGTAG